MVQLPSVTRGLFTAARSDPPPGVDADPFLRALAASERVVAGQAFERALISDHEANQARARAAALAEAGLCGRTFDFAISAISRQVNGNAAYAHDLLSVVADEAHLPAAANRERFVDVSVPAIAARHGRSEAVVSRDLRRANAIARKLLHDADDVPTALTHLLGLSGDAPRLFVRLAGASDTTSAGAQDTVDWALDSILALGRAGGPRRSSHRDAVFERPVLCLDLAALVPGLETNMTREANAEALLRLTSLAAEARRSDVVLLLDTPDEARLAATLDLVMQVRRHASLAGWDGFGLSISAESKRAFAILRRLFEAGRRDGFKMPVRLAHTTSLASDLAWAIASGLADYPSIVTPAIAATNYIACARALLSERDVFHAIFDGATAAERATIEALGSAQPYDVVVSGPAWRERGKGVEHTVGAGCERLGLEIGPSDHVLARWRDPAAAPRVIAALAASDRAGEPDVVETYLAEPRNPIAAVGALLDPAIADDADDVVAIELRAPNASVAGKVVAARAPVDQPGFSSGDDGGTSLTLVTEEDPAQTTEADALQRPGPHAPRSGWAALSPAERAGCLAAVSAGLQPAKCELVAALRACGLTARDAEAEWLAIDEALAGAVRALRQTSAAHPSTGIAHITGSAADAGRIGIVGDAAFLFAEALAICFEALARGNAVTCLVPPEAAAPMLLLERELKRAGVPAGVYDVATEPAAGDALTLLVETHDALVVAGTPELAGRVLRAQAQVGAAAQPLTRLVHRPSLAIVDGTVSLTQTAAAVAASIAAFAGQRSGALRTILVADDVADPFAEELVDHLARLPLGPTDADTTRLGPMLTDDLRDAAHAEKLRLMQDATLLFDGDLATALISEPFVSPAVFLGAHADELVIPRALGPLVGIVPVPADELADMGDGVMALAASGQPWDTVAVFSANRDFADGIGRHIRSRRLLHDCVPFGTATADAHLMIAGALSPGRYLPADHADGPVRMTRHGVMVS
jgi:RHH-type proline utilization regulon transcriptional repressor/proline dehydrogenase/delta 1-pyrroline-5-carboxylate dehydrogenase